MRLTVSEQIAYGLPNFQVSLDGKPVDRVVMFDTDNGVVERILVDEKGDIVANGDCYETYILTGVVTVRVAP